MAKRMIDTELWNDENIIENFTAEDKYFWLYLLTSPHNSICGVLKYSPSLMARDMGLHKDTIVNLIYRFENVHKLIVTDKDTSEIVILNWGKYNWTSSPKVMSFVNKEIQAVKSANIVAILTERVSNFTSKKKDNPDTVSIPYAYPPNTIINNIEDNTNYDKVNTESNSNYTDTQTNSKVHIDSVQEWFEIVYKLYPRKVSKVQAKQTFEHKFIGMSEDDAKAKIKVVKKMLEAQCAEWQQENNGLGRRQEYIPHFSSWLNDNVEDSPHYKRGRR